MRMPHVPLARNVANDPDSASVRRVEPSRQQIGRAAYIEQDKPLPSRPSQATSEFHKKRVCCQEEEEKSHGNPVHREITRSAEQVYMCGRSYYNYGSRRTAAKHC